MKIHPIFAVAVLATAAAPPHSWALGLGELTLFSYLNEPFRAEVELLEVDALDDSDVHVDLASDTEFERLGVSREFFLTRIDFEIQSDESGRRVVLTTEAPLREPYLDFVIEARWPDGRVLREYTVLIDLPPRQSTSASKVGDAESQRVAAEPRVVDDTSDSPALPNDGAAVSSRPAPGGEYLVTNNDTLWRIASEAAVDGVSIEQTMLKIVAANPAAFRGGNINGLKSGYVLQIPGPEDLQVDLATALDEVSIQNEEWQQGVSRAAQGLTLVADSLPDDDVLAVELDATSDAATGSAAPDAVDDGSRTEAAVEPTGSINSVELEALSATVASLQSSIQALEAQLAERDEELAALRAAVARQPLDAPPPIVIETAVSPEAPPVTNSQSLPLWPFLLGVFVLMGGIGAMIWRRRGATGATGEYKSAEDSTAVQGDEETATSRLSDPQIMASKAVEEAQIYIAYGRTDQAAEVLSDALVEGLSSPTLNMCLLECYVELEQYAEAGALLSRLERAESPELLSRARQMLFDAGVTLTLSSKSGVDASQDEVVVDSGEASVLSEFSFSTDPTFDLRDEPSHEGETDAEENDAFSGDEANEADGPMDAGVPDDLPLEAEALDAAAYLSAEPDLSIEAPAVLSDKGQGQSLSSLAADEQGLTDDAMADLSDAGEVPSDNSDLPNTSGLSLAPMNENVDLSGANSAEKAGADESIYGAETDPVDSKLDLARAYIDMGDEEGARPVLMDVIKEGDLTQQAEARELLLRLEAP
jgi:pilus assembly protein FimV